MLLFQALLNLQTNHGIVKRVGVSFPRVGGRLHSFRLPALRSPSPLATSRHPLQPNKLLAAISPKPSITPLINGSRRLIARLEASARNRARLESVLSKMESVTDGGATGGSVNGAPDGVFAPLAWVCEVDWCCPPDDGAGAPELSSGGKLMDGYEDVRDSGATFSQPLESSSPDPEAALRFGC